jgi:hypothetical protein
MRMYECQVLITVQLEANDCVEVSNSVERSLIPVMKECFDYSHTSIIRGRVLGVKELDDALQDEA